MVKFLCSIDSRELHQSPAFIHGPPDIMGRVRVHPICRSCFRELAEMLRLRRLAPRILPIRHDETPPGRRSGQAG